MGWCSLTLFMGVLIVIIVLAVLNERRHARLGHDSFWVERKKD